MDAIRVVFDPIKMGGFHGSNQLYSVQQHTFSVHEIWSKKGQIGQTSMQKMKKHIWMSGWFH